MRQLLESSLAKRAATSGIPLNKAQRTGLTEKDKN